MGALAQNLRDIGYFQGVTLPLLYAQQVLDHNHNGMLFLVQNITSAKGTMTEQLITRYNTYNDTFISINEELKPWLIYIMK
jgi:hypothetical protein